MLRSAKRRGGMLLLAWIECSAILLQIEKSLERNADCTIHISIPYNEKGSTIVGEVMRITRKNERRALALKSTQPLVPLPKQQKAEWLQGECLRDLCADDLACQDGPRKTHMCVCPSDGDPPDSNGQCTRNVVPATSNPISFEHIVPINVSLSSSKAPMHKAGDSSILLALIATLVVSLTITAAFCWWKRQSLANCSAGRTKRKNNEGTSPTSFSKALLSNFVTNPQYIAETSFDLMPVPVLSRDSIVFIQDIGEGCFGKVFKGKLQKTDGGTETVAVKVLKETATKQAEEDFMREVEIMSTFRHDNILSLIGIVSKDNGGTPWMVFEFMPYGDLAEVLRRNSKQLWKPVPGLRPLTKTCLLKIAVEIAGGMRYLSEQRFVHNDLACRNCLVGEGLTVKIADFGMSRDIYTCDYYRIGNAKPVPLRWMSPESVMYRRFTLESDVWSFGVVLWEIYSFGKQPYYGLSNDEVIKLILENIMLIPPSDCPPSICDLMRACWKSDPKNRIKFPEISARLNEMYEAALSSGCSGVSLPRPPEMPVTSITSNNKQQLDGENYLAPNVTEMIEYLQPLPD